MTSANYIGMDVHTESISIAVRNSVGKVVMECVIETKASTILQFIDGIRGDVRVAFEEGTWSAWLYDLLKPHVTEVVVCNTRKNVQDGSKSDRIDARKLSEMLYMNNIKSVYHGQHGLRTLKELGRSYLTIIKDLSRVMNRLKALYRSWAIPCAGKEVYEQTATIDSQGHIEEDRVPDYNKLQSVRYAFLTVTDARSRESLWEFSERWGGLLTGFDSVGKRLVQEFEKQTQLADERFRLKLVKSVNPAYPPEASRKHIEGVVVVRVAVDKRGTVTSAKALRDC